MCIFLVSSAHKKFPLILIDNRDEVSDRSTMSACWWNDRIYAPRDLESPSKGTWIGVTKTGRFVALVNTYEEEKKTYPVSRGSIARRYLEAEKEPHEWAEWLRGLPDFTQCGGFTMVMGITRSDGSVHFEFLSNHDRCIPAADHTVAVSNGPLDDPSWVKTSDAMALFKKVLTSNEVFHLADQSLQLLSDSRAPVNSRYDLRKNIFIYPITCGGDVWYGTRTQTVIVIDDLGRLIYTERDLENDIHIEKIDLEIN